MPQTRQNKGPEEILQDMAKEARDPWTYYYYGRPKRDIMLPIRVTAAERDAIRAAAKWENKPVAGFIRAAIAVRAEKGFCKAARKGTNPRPSPGARV